MEATVHTPTYEKDLSLSNEDTIRFGFLVQGGLKFVEYALLEDSWAYCLTLNRAFTY